jgi:hypothetical protein
MLQSKYAVRVMIWVTIFATAAVFVLPSTAQDEPVEDKSERLIQFEGYLEAFSMGDADALSQYLTENHLRHHLFGPSVETGELQEYTGIEAIGEMVVGFANEMPGVEFFVIDSVERDDWMWVKSSSNEVPGIDGLILDTALLARWEGDKIAEIWVANDELALLSLLNALPGMEE